MFGLFEDDEDDVDYDGPWDLKFHSSSDVKDLLFMFEYMFPEAWERKISDMKKNGLVISDLMSISYKMAEDAIEAGLFSPFIYVNEVGQQEVEIKYWSVFRYFYYDIEDMLIYEVYWLFLLLERMIWSYN